MSTLSGTGGAIALDAANLTVDQANDTSFAGSISGSGSFTKDGTGKLDLTGVSSYTGATAVNGGLLSVNGDISSSSGVTIGAGGTIGGNGRLPGVTVSSGGILAPGNSIGAITVNGNLAFGAGSTYAVEVDPVSADHTVIIGSADLSGATVVASYAAGSYVAKSYTILTAEGGLGSTEFAALQGTAPTGFTQELAYSNDDTVELVLDLEMRPQPEEPGIETPSRPNPYSNLNRNQQAVANAIVEYFDAHAGIQSEFGALTPEGLTQASAETGAAGIAAGQQAADQFLATISTPQFGDTGGNAPSGEPLAFAAGETAAGRVERVFGADFGTLSAPDISDLHSYWQSWGAAYGSGARSDGNTTIGSSDITSQSWGLAAGHDIAFGGTSLGVALGGGWGSYDLENGFGSGNIGSFNAGIRGTQELGPGYVSGALAYGYHAFSTSRTVTGERYEADYSAHSLSGRAEAGWRFQTPLANLAPYGAVETIALLTPAYGEDASGAGLFALNYQAEDTISTRLELGARVSHTIDLNPGNGKLTLSGRAAWQHNLNPDRDVTAGFATLAGTSFVTDAAAASRNSLLVSLGADYAMNDSLSFGLSADAQIGDSSRALAGKAQIRFRW
jgi:autotransporter-associated beta strand protein